MSLVRHSKSFDACNVFFTQSLKHIICWKYRPLYGNCFAWVPTLSYFLFAFRKLGDADEMTLMMGVRNEMQLNFYSARYVPDYTD